MPGDLININLANKVPTKDYLHCYQHNPLSKKFLHIILNQGKGVILRSTNSVHLKVSWKI